MNEHTPIIIINIGVIIIFFLWVLYNSYQLNDPIMMNLVGLFT